MSEHDNANNFGKASPMNEQQHITAEVAHMIDSPLFAQIAAMMVACRSAKNMVDVVMEGDKGGTVSTSKTLKRFKEFLGILVSHLAAIDFDHGQEIVAGALDACRMVQPNVDIVCSGFSVGMPQKSKNPDKNLFLKGGIAANKAAIIWLDKEGAEQLIKAVNGALDILHPGRLVGLNGTPKLIVG